MKYSILMPYISRPALLHNTLVSFDYHYKSRNDWEIILVEDPKNLFDPIMHGLLQDAVAPFVSRLPLNLLSYATPNIHNPSLAFNLAAKRAQGRYFILTSPEVFHQANVLRGLDMSFNGNPIAYVICSCLLWKNFNLRIPTFDTLGGGSGGWYQHFEHRNAKLHFCSALSRSTWECLGGFDPAFAYGYGWEDQDFIERIEAADVPIIYRDDLVTLHQEHGPLSTWGGPMFDRNHNLYLKKKREKDEKYQD